jgi:CHAT domain-containing protein
MRVLVVLGALALCGAARAGTREDANDLFTKGAEAYNAGAMDVALDAYTRALAFYQKIPDALEEQADCQNALGSVLDGLGRYDEAIAKEKLALALYQKLKGSEGSQAMCLMQIATTYFETDRHAEAIATATQALKLCDNSDDGVMKQANCHKIISLSLWRTGKLQSALTEQETALRQIESLKNDDPDLQKFFDGMRAECYVNSGSILSDMGRYEDALARTQSALKIFEAGGFKPAQAQCHQNLGALLDDLQRYDESLAEKQKALALFQTLPGTERAQAGVLMNIGVTLSSLARYPEAIDQLKTALKMLEPIAGAERDVALCCEDFAEPLIAMARYDEATGYQQRALKIFQAIPGNEIAQAQCLRNIALAREEAGRYEQSLQTYDQILALLAPLEGAARERADVTRALGSALHDMGRNGDAIAKAEAALKIYKTLENSELDQIKCSVNIAVALDDLDRHEEALGRYVEALSTLQKLPHTERDQALLHMDIAGVLVSLRQMEYSRSHARRALELYRQIAGSERDQANCLSNLAFSLATEGDRSGALAQYQAALQLIEPIKGSERQQILIEGNIAQILLDSGRLEESLAASRQVMAVAQRLDGRDDAQSLRRIGDAQRLQSHYDEALASYDAADKLQSGWLVDYGRAMTYAARHKPGDAQLALNAFVEGKIEIEQLRFKTQSTSGRAETFEEPSKLYADAVNFLYDTDEKFEMIEAGNNSFKFPRPLEGWDLAPYFSEAMRGRALRDALLFKAQPSSARPDIKLLAREREQAAQISALSARREAASPTDTDLRKQLDEEIALAQNKRNLLEAEIGRAADAGSNAMLLASMSQEDADTFRHAMLENEPQIAVLEYSVGSDAVWLMQWAPKTAAKQKLDVAPGDLKNQSSAATLGQLLQAWRTDPQSVGLSGLIRLARERAEDKARETPQNLVSADDERKVLERLGNVLLPDNMLWMLRGQGVKQLVILPDGPLHFLLFSMLRLPRSVEARGVSDNKVTSMTAQNVETLEGAPADHHYLAQEFSCAYAPSLGVLQSLRNIEARRAKSRPARRELLAFANPDFGAMQGETAVAGDDLTTLGVPSRMRAASYAGSGLRLVALPETETEATQVASLFGAPQKFDAATKIDLAPAVQSCVLSRRAAGKAQVLELLGARANTDAVTHWKYLLFSTHGLSDPEDGMRSCLALSPSVGDDGFLQAQEVMNFDLDTDLVMLSACQTGLGKLRRGEGVLGLSAAFFNAGAQSVAASLWSVPSGPTSQLVEEFFVQLESGKVSRAEALRQAQLTVLRDPRYREPWCWAAFVLVGEYR